MWQAKGRTTAVAVLLTWLMVPSVVHADVRIKDIIDIQGVRVTRLVGMGLVTGLSGTGGKSPVTRQFAMNMLDRFGIRSDPEIRRAIRNDQKFRTQNLSVVTVTAELPIFVRPGRRIDVTVSAFDDATSLQGGTLIMTPLFGVDSKIYAMASGAVSVGGFRFSGAATDVQKNHPTTGRVPNGAVVEHGLNFDLSQSQCVNLLLRHPDFETARRVADAINHVLPNAATTLDPATVKVIIPPDQKDVVTFISLLGSLQVQPDVRARVVINERTGTIVVGEHVRLSKVAITHADLAVITEETPRVSQPAPFSKGRTTVVPRTSVDVIEDSKPVQVVPEPVTVEDLAQALNALGVTPRDMSSIFQHLKRSGALHAELVFE